MLDTHTVGETCTGMACGKGMTLRQLLGPSRFRRHGMIDIGNWEDGMPQQQIEFQTSLGTTFDNTSVLELDRYLTTMIEMLRLKEKLPEQA